nr:hypothetical protein Iba_chr04bCG18010 [Ipomoea batatas]
MPVRRRSGSATLRQTAAGVSRIGRLFGRRRLRLAFSKWAGSPAEGDSGSSSRSVSDGLFPSPSLLVSTPSIPTSSDSGIPVVFDFVIESSRGS